MEDKRFICSIVPFQCIHYYPPQILDTPLHCIHLYQSGDHSEIIKHMARLVDSIEVPAAKAAILWVMGEYCERVPKIAPDVLRKMAKSFTNEDPAVKMQVMSGI